MESVQWGVLPSVRASRFSSPGGCTYGNDNVITEKYTADLLGAYFRPERRYHSEQERDLSVLPSGTQLLSSRKLIATQWEMSWHCDCLGLLLCSENCALGCFSLIMMGWWKIKVLLRWILIYWLILWRHSGCVWRQTSYCIRGQQSLGFQGSKEKYNFPRQFSV